MDLFKSLESKEIILLDGAMGTQLDKRGLMGRGGTNIDAPDAVVEIHGEYVRSGCKGLTTNTLTMNRIFIETHKLDVDVREVNLAGAKLAKQAANGELFVLGDISSTGQLLAPYGSYTEKQFYDSYKAQAEALAAGGVDGFIIETVFDLREAMCALKACKDNFGLPVIVSMTFSTEEKGARTIMGNTAEECAKKLTEAGADVIGANCGDLDPEQMAVVVGLLKEATSVPVLAQPNAGKPKLIEDKTVFDMDADTFAEGIGKCIDAGANIVGGCCGTSPEHIKAVADLLS